MIQQVFDEFCIPSHRYVRDESAVFDIFSLLAEAFLGITQMAKLKLFYVFCALQIIVPTRNNNNNTAKPYKNVIKQTVAL